jgi:hypothetical protein
MLNKKPVNYLNNKDILKEIHESKNSYCSYKDEIYNKYDLILECYNEENDSQNNLLERVTRLLSNDETINKAKENRVNRILQETNTKIDISEVNVTDLIFRVMTWDHIPVSPKQPRKINKKKTAKDLFEFEEDNLEEIFAELEDDTTKAEVDDMVHVKVNFPPFQHFKIDEFNNIVCVGKSHWKGDLETGEFSKDHGSITNKLAKMYIMLCEKYAMKFNWRGYCVDDQTEALTKRGWLNIDEINEDDYIMSYNNGQMSWSSIKSIYRGNFNGKLFKLTNRNVDMLITPNHKLVTTNGLKEVELLTETDRLILMGKEETSVTEKIYSDAFVELAGWIFTEGTYDIVKSKNFLKGISIYQNEGINAQRIRNSITGLGFKLYERPISEKCISFSFPRKDANQFYSLFPEKMPTMEFICSLTADQRKLLIDTMIEGDGWYRGKNRSYTQKNSKHLDIFEALCAMSGIRTKRGLFKEIISFGKLTNCYEVHLYSQRNNITRVENINMHGAKRTGVGTKSVGKGKKYHPNEPTINYKGRVWCPETEFGCFLARRNNHIYLTGNTYNDEMRSSAILQLTYVGLRFNEAKSQNPFAYYTAAITNSFCRVLNTEKKNQNIRDDILEINGLAPSWSRQGANGFDRFEE